MNKYIIALIITISSAIIPVKAQISAAELNQGIQGMNSSDYYRLSQETDRVFSQGNFAQAVEGFEKLTKVFPFDAVKWRRLGFSFYQLKKYREAVEPFMKAHKIGHTFGDINTGYYIAASYARAGDSQNALKWLEKIINEYRYPDKPGLIDDPAFESIKNDSRFLKLFGLPKKELMRDAGWRGDVDYLLAEIKRLNPVYSIKPLPAELTQAAERLKAQIPKLADHEIFFEMEHLIVLLGQAHNELFVSTAGNKVNLTQLPLTFYIFPEGVYIVDAEKPYEDLIGARVTMFDKTTAETAVKRLDYIVPRENDVEVLWRGPDFLKVVQMLHAIKISEQPDRINLTVLDRMGKTRTVAPVPIAVQNRPKLKAPRLEGLAPAPLYLSKPDDKYWFENMPADKTVYFQFNSVTNKQSDESMNKFAVRLREFLGKNEVDNLIVDLRRNNGGETVLYPELLRTLIDFDAQHPGRMFVLIGRTTFSATGNFITDLSRLTNAVFVGEPSGAKPLLVGGDEVEFVLPYSGAKGNLSGTTWALTFPRDSRLWITPSIPAQLTAKDYFANRDTVLETLLGILREDTKK